MLLFIDTETSGLPDFSLPVDHPAQPHIVQLAAWLGEWQEQLHNPLIAGIPLEAQKEITLRHVASLNTIIRPTDWTINPHAERVHGISLERARAVGEDLAEVLGRLFALVVHADADGLGVHGTLVAHNLSFDHRMILRECATVGLDPTPLGRLRPFCTMRALTARMKLPGRHPGQYKWPSLGEAHRFCFPDAVRTVETQHTAMGDVLECRDIYTHGRTQEWWP